MISNIREEIFNFLKENLSIGARMYSEAGGEISGIKITIYLTNPETNKVEMIAEADV
jgi:hypothetical protein